MPANRPPFQIPCQNESVSAEQEDGSSEKKKRKRKKKKPKSSEEEPEEPELHQEPPKFEVRVSKSPFKSPVDHILSDALAAVPQKAHVSSRPDRRHAVGERLSFFIVILMSFYLILFKDEDEFPDLGRAPGGSSRLTTSSNTAKLCNEVFSFFHVITDTNDRLHGWQILVLTATLH